MDDDGSMLRRRSRLVVLASVSAAIALIVAACGDRGTGGSESEAISEPVASVALAAPVGSPPPVPASTAGPVTETTLAPSIRQITCTTHIRSVLTSPPTAGPVVTFDVPGTQTADFADLRFTGLVEGDDTASRSLFLRVSTLPDDQQVFGAAYQFSVDPNVNSFQRTGQGFTGLLYVYNPITGAELQITCAAHQ